MDHGKVLLLGCTYIHCILMKTKHRKGVIVAPLHKSRTFEEGLIHWKICLLLCARYLRYNKTSCQVSHMQFYLVPGVLQTPEPGAGCPMCTFTWCQVSEIPQNLVPGVPHAVLLGARYLTNPRTWCQGSHMHFYLAQSSTPRSVRLCGVEFSRNSLQKRTFQKKHFSLFIWNKPADPLSLGL